MIACNLKYAILRKSAACENLLIKDLTSSQKLINSKLSRQQDYIFISNINEELLSNTACLCRHFFPTLNRLRQSRSHDVIP